MNNLGNVIESYYIRRRGKIMYGTIQLSEVLFTHTSVVYPRPRLVWQELETKF